MNVYVFIGTHLPEISRCMDHLIRSSNELNPVEIHVPEGLQWEVSGERYPVNTYNPETVLWVLDPDKEGTCFILIDPRAGLIRQLEKMAEQLGNCLIEPVKVLTCVDCEQAENHSKLRSWLDACIYYSDIVLLGNRENTSKSFVRDFQKHYERLCYPCLFLFLKGQGIPVNVNEILTPETRRISQIFDLDKGEGQTAVAGVLIESSCDLDLEEAEIDPYRSAHDDESKLPVPDPSEFIVHHP